MLRFAIYPPAYLGFENPAKYFESLVETAKLAESNGIDQIWVTDRHGKDQVYLPKPNITISALAQHARTIRLGCFLPLPLYHPVHVAEEAALLDQMTRGRFSLGCVTGNLNFFDVIGLPSARRVSQTFESIQIIRELLINGTISSHRGENYTLKSASLAFGPVQKPHPPVVVPGFTSSTVTNAGRFGVQWIPSQFAEISHWRGLLAVYESEYSRGGRGHASERWAHRIMYITEGEESGRALERVAGFIAKSYPRMRAELSRQGLNFDLRGLVDRGIILVGGVEYCRRHLNKLVREIGANRILLRLHPPRTPVAEMHRMLKTLGTEIIPDFQAS